MKLLLHACCGPCSLEPVRIFSQEGTKISIDYTNPNIHPADEYAHRLSTIKEHVADPDSIDLFEGDYDPDVWNREVGKYGLNRKARCRACYRLRFERVATRAAKLGFDAISSTLTISPYQFTDIILEELQRAADIQGLQAVLRDFRPCYPEATRRSHELGMYRQNYCGCHFSIVEAETERAAHKVARDKAKRIKHDALIQLAAEGNFNQPNQL